MNKLHSLKKVSCNKKLIINCFKFKHHYIIKLTLRVKLFNLLIFNVLRIIYQL